MQRNHKEIKSDEFGNYHFIVDSKNKVQNLYEILKGFQQSSNVSGTPFSKEPSAIKPITEEGKSKSEQSLSLENDLGRIPDLGDDILPKMPAKCGVEKTSHVEPMSLKSINS